jgi:hypothetical protein
VVKGDGLQACAMKYLTFCIRIQFRCSDGSKFGFTFEEGQWVMRDAPSTLVNNKVVVYTPRECLERALRVFFSGLTEAERNQAAKSLVIVARQAHIGDVMHLI